jgi:hypothetical protein
LVFARRSVRVCRLTIGDYFGMGEFHRRSFCSDP